MHDLHHMCTKFDVSSFSLFKDMIGDPENQNCSRDLLTTPISGIIRHPMTIIATNNLRLPTRFEVYISTHCKNMKGDTKCGKWGGLG